jgi:6-phosphogluconolactonase
VQAATDAVAARGRCGIALAGGTAPQAAYALLATREFAGRVHWPAVHFFWGDERAVPRAHPRSNFGMAWRALLRHLPLPPGNLHRMRGELPPAEAAAHYAEVLGEWVEEGVPRLDLVHLGLGPDAHTASLFPFDPLLLERERWVAPALNRPLGEWRITLTFPALNAARALEMFVVGAGKAAVVRQVLAGPLDPLRLPAQGLRPRSGSLHWLLDREAAREL